MFTRMSVVWSVVLGASTSLSCGGSTPAEVETETRFGQSLRGGQDAWCGHWPKPPKPVGVPLGVSADLSAGADHTCVGFNGKLKCFGRNILGGPTGQHSFDRGLEAADMVGVPAIDFGSCGRATALAMGAYHACAILAGRVKCWGDNADGTLGLGDSKVHGASELSRPIFVNLGARRYAKAITAGDGFTCALLDRGAIKCWGSNTYGQLGRGDMVPRGADPGDLGDQMPTVDLGTGKQARLVRSGTAHSCAILTDDTVKCWGLNNYGQLGLGDTARRGALPGEMGDALPLVDLGSQSKPVELALGNYHSCVRFADRTVKCWGHNERAQLGLGDTEHRGDEPSEMGAALPTIDLGPNLGAKAITVGGHVSCALLDNARVKCWGENEYGWLGSGDPQTRGDEPGEMGASLAYVDFGTTRPVTHIVATQINTCAAFDNGSIKCWGAPWSGMLGIGRSGVRGTAPGQMGRALPSFRLGHSCSINNFGNGFGYHSGCALLDDGRIKCWGSNSYGQLGSGRTNHTGDEASDMGAALNPIALGAQANVVSAGTGMFHSCALLSNRTVKCWGLGRLGVLGLGDDIRRDGRTSFMGDRLPALDFGGHAVRSLAVGVQHNCVILDDESVRCWGDNSVGQLGAGDSVARGNAADLAPVDLGTGRKARALALGAQHSCALLDNDSIKCWGSNRYGQLGIGDARWPGAQPGEMGDALPAVRLGDGDRPTSIAASVNNTCALLDNGQVKCWGWNNYGQLGVGHAQIRGTQPAHMGNALQAAQLGADRAATAIALGDNYACALLDDGSVKCWGHGALGKLGTGSELDLGTTPAQLGDALAPIDFGSGRTAVAIAAGSQHACALLDDATLKCWGSAEGGRLGLGDTEDRGDEPSEMGGALPPIALGTF